MRPSASFQIRLLRAALAGGILGAGIVACSGATSTDLVTPSTKTTEPNLPGAQDPGPGKGAGMGASGDGSTHDFPRLDGGAVLDGGPGTVPSKDAGADAGQTQHRIFCGFDAADRQVYCASGPSICCASMPRMRSDRSELRCAPQQPTATNLGCGRDDMPISCHDRSDCSNGQVCCGSFNIPDGFSAIQCQSTCQEGPFANAARRRYCDLLAPLDECAQIGKVCQHQPSETLDGFAFCQ